MKGDADVYKRLTATINGEYEIKPWLKVGTTNQIEKYNSRTVSTNNEYGSMLASILQADPVDSLLLYLRGTTLPYAESYERRQAPA